MFKFCNEDAAVKNAAGTGAASSGAASLVDAACLNAVASGATGHDDSAGCGASFHNISYCGSGFVRIRICLPDLFLSQ